MILYLDASALVKRYVAEPGSAEVSESIEAVEAVGTSIISRAETIAALAKAIRVGVLDHDAADSAARIFRTEWQSFIRIQVTESLIARADSLAWELGLRGYDSVHLASAIIWHESMDQELHLVTFDRQLWEAARKRGVKTIPEDLSPFLKQR
jgi:predicted nucleic acid-binding protein